MELRYSNLVAVTSRQERDMRLLQPLRLTLIALHNETGQRKPSRIISTCRNQTEGTEWRKQDQRTLSEKLSES